ncbi:uncharacterized protein N7483_011803 [Penicillium malachiteum]|uniref:uncharacterized protein n=1 Tax=Penicillium malachiteum TaxID=1324776 RepID=UPI002548FD85|nr:uncharacterized protein N7483_011803 [Penicillium malachiteum]KAJ5714622.1 hypothetical protein N7483_011803 [Penicillium malachiteum]
MKGVALFCTLLAGTASAHMQMMKPYPIRSPLNKDSTGQKDYSYTNPLQPSGADYPCKGYANDPFDSQATYQPGQSYDMELDGSATHDGGSCQLALTYDKGKTFKVIESMLGTCPTPKKYNFQIPSDAPSGEALLAWTWFNKVGNREMYMNCAMVTIGGSTNGNNTDAGTDHIENMPAEHGKSEDKKAAHPPLEMATRDVGKKTAFNSLPELFVANVGQEGKCVTVEGETVDFPEPGDDVIGTSDGKGYKCSGSAPFLGSGSSDSTKSNSTSKSDKTNNKDTKPKQDSKTDKNAKSNKDNKDSKSTSTAENNKQKDNKTSDDQKDTNKNATRSLPEAMSKVAQAFGTSGVADTRVLSTDATTNNQFSNYVSRWTCVSGEILCSPDGYSWAMCSNGAPIYMGSVAAGMVCRLGAMVAASW